MNQPVELRGTKFVLLAQFVAEQAGRLVHVMDQLCVFGREVGRVMINDDPVRPVQSLLERQVADPGRFFRQTALTPVVVVVGLQRYVRVEQPARQSPQQETRHQPVQITLVG